MAPPKGKPWVYRAQDIAREMESHLGTCGPYDKPAPLTVWIEQSGVSGQVFRKKMWHFQRELMTRYAAKGHQWSESIRQELRARQPVTPADYREVAHKYSADVENVIQQLKGHGIERAARKYGNWDKLAREIAPGMGWRDLVRLSGVTLASVKKGIVRYLAERGVTFTWRREPSLDHRWDRVFIDEVRRSTP